ncbi:retrotransposon protein, putative, ty1-copia subclass [Tanacetum coccineum]
MGCAAEEIILRDDGVVIDDEGDVVPVEMVAKELVAEDVVDGDDGEYVVFDEDVIPDELYAAIVTQEGVLSANDRDVILDELYAVIVAQEGVFSGDDVLFAIASVVVVRPVNTRHRWDETCLLDIIVIKSTDVVGPNSPAPPTDSEYLRSGMRYMIHNEVACLMLGIGELYVMLIEYEKGLPKKAETPQVMMIKGGKIQKSNKKSLKAKAKDDTCHHCKEVGRYKRNCPAYIAELLKKKKQVGSASSSGWLLKSTYDESFENVNLVFSGKMTKKPFPYSNERAKDLLGIIHTDGVICTVDMVGGSGNESCDCGAPKIRWLLHGGDDVLEGDERWCSMRVAEGRGDEEVEEKIAEFFEKKLYSKSWESQGSLKKFKMKIHPPSENHYEISIVVAGIEPPPRKIFRFVVDRCYECRNTIHDGQYGVGPVDLSPGCRTVRSKLIFKKKTDVDGTVHTYKARLVAKGYTQLYGVNYEETFVDPNPLERYASYKDLFMVLSKNQKARIKDLMRKSKVMGNHIPSLQSVKNYLGKCFSMKDLGEAAFILGIKIYRDRSKRLIRLGQNAYMDKILKRYKMDNSKRGRIPMQERLDLNKTQGASKPKENPGECHWTAVKNILKYLKNTKNVYINMVEILKLNLELNAIAMLDLRPKDIDDMKSLQNPLTQLTEA